MSEVKRILRNARLEPLYELFSKLASLFRTSRVTKAEALEIARQHNLEAEREAMRKVCSPGEALEEWDIPA
jgi:hypothetical protein